MGKGVRAGSDARGGTSRDCVGLGMGLGLRGAPPLYQPNISVLFIPAGCLHSGGCADASGDSTLLSLALPPTDADAAAAATGAVNRWKEARQLILERAPSRCLEWEAAGSASGRAAIREACVGSAGTLVGPFLLDE